MKKPDIAAFASGAIFAIGLAVGGMARPEKIIGFLDFAGAWDASLIFVMVGAVAVYFVAHRVVLRRPAPLFGEKFHIPTRKDIDARLAIGSVLFGVGWGLSGLCPGPGLVSAGGGSFTSFVFVVGMTLGIAIESGFLRRRAAAAVTS